MRIIECRLSKDLDAFLREELARVEGLLTSRGRPLPHIDVSLADLSDAGGGLPQAVRLTPPTAGSRPAAFDALCAWERQRQSYQVIVRDKTAWIVGGGAEGAVYGFYALLRQTAGVCWCGWTDEDIVLLEPAAPSDAVHEPDVVLRGLEGSLGSWDRGRVQLLLRWMVRNRLNLVLFHASQWDACPYRDEIIWCANLYGIRLAIGGHAAERFLPESEFEIHPEFFGLRNGKRCLQADVVVPDVGVTTSRGPIQPCYSNPDAMALMANNMARYIEDHEEMAIFSLWPHDGINNWCQCRDCRATTPYEMMHRLARRVAEETRRPVPIELIAYTNLLDTPRCALVPCDRIYTLFCPYLRRYQHRFFDPGFDAAGLTLGVGYPDPEPVNPVDDREYGVLLDRWRPHWREARVGLGVFAYYQLVFHDETRRSDRSRYLYHPDPALVEAEIREYKRQGMQVFYDCSWPHPGFWPDGRTYAYLPSLLWSEHPTAGALVQVYYKATLGDLGAAVGEIMSRLDQILSHPQRQPVPETLQHGLRAAFDKIGGAAGRRYHLWLDYVCLADRSWHAAQAGDIAGVIRLEDEIVRLFDAHREALHAHILIPWMQNYSRSVIQYFEQGT